MRKLVLLTALCLPVSLLAQQPQAAGPSNNVARTFLGFGQPYGYWLVVALDSIPANKYNFRPTPVQQTVGFIAQHLENANYELCARIAGKKRVASPKDALPDTVKAQWPKDTLIARVRASLEFCGDAIRSLSDNQLADTLMAETPSGPQPVLRVRYPILLVTDLAEHYAQLAGYMRILGLIPPSALPLPRR